MTDVIKPGTPSKRVTVVDDVRKASAGSRGSHGSSKRSGSPEKRVPSAVQRWKRQHEQTMMEKLVGLRNEKKELTKISREQATNVARKIPTEILARDWLNITEATLEARGYLVDRLLPTLILGVEKLLNEADKRGLADGRDERDPNFNPINFLAQYLMRNNPKYSNFSEASPYVRGLREVTEELKKELFNIEDNRLARIKLEAKRRREEREQIESAKQVERIRRLKLFMEQFTEWTSKPDGRVELSVLQNALRSFVELSERFPDSLRDVAKLSHPLEDTDESGKSLMVREFAKYLTSYVDDLPLELFRRFMMHMVKCAGANRFLAQREARRIHLTNLFLSCDRSGIGLLDRHRILSLFETYWDVATDGSKEDLRNPRKWPVVEVDEADDTLSDDEEESITETKAPPKKESAVKESGEEQKEEKVEKQDEKKEEEAKQEEQADKDKEATEVKDETKTGIEQVETTEEKSDEQTDEKSEEKSEQKTEEKSEEKTEEQEKEKTEDEQQKKEEVEEEKEKEQSEEKQEEKQEEPQVEVTEEQKEVVETEEVGQEKTETKEGEGEGEKNVEEMTDGEKKEEEMETQMKEGGTTTEQLFEDQEPAEEKSPKTDGEEQMPNSAETEKDIEADVVLTGELLKSEPKTPALELQPASVSFAEGTAFERDKTAMTTLSRSHSLQSMFDESSLNVSQFVLLTETFLGDDPTMTSFEQLLKFVKDEYQETEEEKMERLLKARREAMSSRRKMLLDQLFEKWDNDGSGYLDQEDVEEVMQKYKDGQENVIIEAAKSELKKKMKHPQDNRLSKREFRQFVTLVADGMPEADAFEYFVEFLNTSVERTYAERIRGEARKKWLQQIITAAETSGANIEPVYKAIFQALFKDAEAHGAGKQISSSIAMLERNTTFPERGDVCLRYVAATTEDAEIVLGKILYKDMPGISFSAVESGKPIHVPRVANHGNIQFWNPYRHPDDREGSFIVIPLKDRRKRVFGLLGLDTLNDRHTKSIFITHEIQFYQGVAKSFSISYHNIDMRKKLLRITESAVSWIQRRSPHVKMIICYMVEPEETGKDYVLRKMMTTDKKGNIQSMPNPARLERKDNLFRDYLFKAVDNSESVSADAYGERHLAFPLRDDQGKAVAIVDLSLGELKQLPSHENREVQRMLRLLQMAHKEITKEMAGGDKNVVLEAENNEETRMDIMFDRLMLMELRENVQKVDSKAFAELRSYIDPPVIVHDILKAVSAIFNMEDTEQGLFDDWTQMKGQINMELMQKIATYDPTAGQELIPPDRIERYLQDVPHGEVAKHSSVPAQHMYNWVFVCLSLIEHTLKMRENNNDNLLPVGNAKEEKSDEGDPDPVA